METTERIRFLEANLGRQLSWIRAADSRLTLAFALNTGMLGVLAAVSPKQATAWAVAPAIFASFAAAFALASLICLTFASFPRVKGPRGSLVFFEGIAQHTAAQFKEAVTALSDESYIDDLVNQCHRNAEIASRKFSWVQRAFICLYLAVPAWGVAVFLLYNIGG
jgi:hypothetical protein